MQRRRCARAAAVLFLAASPALAPAANLFWDPNGAAAGVGGNGTWDFATPNFNDSTGTGTPVAWTDGNDAIFNGAASYTVTIPAGVTVSPNSVGLGIAAGNTTVTGGTLLITSPTASFVMNTHTSGAARAQLISSTVAGTDITQVANLPGSTNARLDLMSANTFTGDLNFAGTGAHGTFNSFAQININTAAALPATANVNMRRESAQLLFTAGGAAGTAPLVASFANPIDLNASGSGFFIHSGLGAANSGTIATLTGPISGNAHLNLRVAASGGQGVIVLANPNNSYTGSTNLLMQTNATAAGVLRLGVDDALPVTTTVNFAGTTAAAGALDLDGFNQKIAGLTNTTTGNIAGVVNTSNTLSTLTIDGNLVTTYTGTIGLPNALFSAAPSLAGATDQIALVLAPSNTGQLTLREANAYAGGTTIHGGTLLVNSNAVPSGTGSGPVSVGANGRFGGTGTAAGPVAAAGTLLPGGPDATGTLSLVGGLTLSAGSAVDFDVSATANDQLFLSSLALPAAAQSVTLNLRDLGGAFRNQTYTLATGTLPPGIDLSNTGAFTVVGPASGAARNATFTLSQDASNNLQVTVAGVANYLTWRGDASGSGDFNTSLAHFDNAGSPSTFAEPDEVTFDSSANGTGPVTVNLPASLNPGRLVFNVTDRDYTLTGSPIVGNATLLKTGAGTLVLAASNQSAGPMILRAGTTQVSAPTFNASTAPIVLEGGTLQPTNAVSSTVPVTINTTGTINVAAGADSTLGPIFGNNLVKSGDGKLTTGQVNLNLLSVSAGVVALDPLVPHGGRIGNLVVTAGQLDIGDHSLIISSTVTENALRTALAAARNTGNWDGTAGLTSSVAAADPDKTTAIGYWNANDIAGTPLGALPAGPSDNILHTTVYGDTNANGFIDPDDFANIDRAVAMNSTPRWITGDFNYDNLIDINDYFLLDRSYLLQITPSPAFLDMRAAQFGDAYVTSLLASVPEPASLSSILYPLSSLLFLRRRRRRMD